MIVRTWHGCVPVKHASGFDEHLQVTGVKHSQGVQGNLGAFVRRETQGEWEHFFLATYWQNIESVIDFAGQDYHMAVTYSDDECFELMSDPYVFHHEVSAIVSLA
jgi:hypothetical protein